MEHQPHFFDARPNGWNRILALYAARSNRHAHFMTTISSRQWPTSLLSCCASPGGLPRCCLACWCPCLSYAELLKEQELKGYCCYNDRISACVSYALLQALGFFPAAALHAGARSALRTERNYSGSLSEDFCATACCSTCALVQELNAADLRQQQQQMSAAPIVGLPPRPVRMTTMSGGRPVGGAVTRGGLKPPFGGFKTPPHASPTPALDELTGRSETYLEL